MFKRGEIYRNKNTGDYTIITDSFVDRPKYWFYTVLDKDYPSSHWFVRIKTESVDKGYLKLNKEKKLL